jgi:hypothetical protein
MQIARPGRYQPRGCDQLGPGEVLGGGRRCQVPSMGSARETDRRTDRDRLAGAVGSAAAVKVVNRNAIDLRHLVARATVSES